MKFDNFAMVCRVDGCHGRIKPYDPKFLSRGVCANCGTDTDEWERVNRPDEWARRQAIEGQRLQERLQDDMFAEYQKLDGQKDRERFDATLDIFYATTLKAYVDGEGDRRRAFKKFKTKAMVDDIEGGRIFDAVDTVTPYT